MLRAITNSNDIYKKWYCYYVLRLIARNVHTKAGVNCTTDDKVMIWKQGTPTVTPYVAFSGDTKNDLFSMFVTPR